MSEEAEVTQADREAAVNWFAAQHAYGVSFMEDVRTGGQDGNDLVRAFARHRLAERERCAKVAETYITGGRDEWDRGSDHAAKGIARNLRPTPSPIAPRV